MCPGMRVCNHTFTYAMTYICMSITLSGSVKTGHLRVLGGQRAVCFGSGGMNCHGGLAGDERTWPEQQSSIARNLLNGGQHAGSAARLRPLPHSRLQRAVWLSDSCSHRLPCPGAQ